MFKFQCDIVKHTSSFSTQQLYDFTKWVSTQSQPMCRSKHRSHKNDLLNGWIMPSYSKCAYITFKGKWICERIWSNFRFAQAREKLPDGFRRGGTFWEKVCLLYGWLEWCALWCLKLPTVYLQIQLILTVCFPLCSEFFFCIFPCIFTTLRVCIVLWFIFYSLA